MKKPHEDGCLFWAIVWVAILGAAVAGFLLS